MNGARQRLMHLAPTKPLIPYYSNEFNFCACYQCVNPSPAEPGYVLSLQTV